MLQAFHYFPSVIYREEHPEWVTRTLALSNTYLADTNEFHKDNPLPRTFPVTQTATMHNDPEFEFLWGHVLRTSQDIMRSERYLVDKYRFYMQGMWLQDIGTYGGQPAHTHKNSQICALFFLDTPEGGSYPVFEDPRTGKHMVELDAEVSNNEVYPANRQVHFPNVIPGTLLYFSSWLSHLITLNASDSNTRLIHFVVSATDRNNSCNM
jgi:uncharacterized protein (TIGR02466 family)